MTARNSPVTPGAQGDLSGRAASSVGWMLSQQWVLRVTGFITVALLTRLLGPEAFGLIAASLALIPFVQLLADLGVSTYLVQAKRPGVLWYSTAFWYSVTTSVLLAGALLAAAPLIGAALGEAEVVPLVRVLALLAPLTSLGMVPLVLLRRAMRFRTMAGQTVIAGALGQVAAIALALSGAGVWSLVVQALLFQLMITALSWVQVRWRPSWRFSWVRLRVMARFGVQVASGDVITSVRVIVENAIIVAVLGPSGLGFFAIAQRLILITQDMATNALLPVSTVAFALLRESSDRVRTGYLRAQGVANAVIVPIMVLLSVTAPVLYPLVFGAQWGPSVAPGQFLALAGVVVVGTLDKGLLLGLGRPALWLLYVGLLEGMTVAVASVAVPHGLVSYAAGVLAVTVAMTGVRWVLVSRALRVPWWRLGEPLGRVALPAAAACAVGVLVAAWTDLLPPLLGLVVTASAVAAVYLPLARWMAPDAWAEAAMLGRKITRRLRRRTREGRVT